MLSAMKRVTSVASIATAASDVSDNSPRDRLSREDSASWVSSLQRFAEPSETLIFLDWDDTLFPTTELFCRHRLSKSDDEAVPQEVAKLLKPWRKAVHDVLKVACLLSDRCVVVTSARRPWVETCIDRFAPELRPLLAANAGGVVYAREASEAPSGWPSFGCGARVSSLGAAKRLAMEREAEELYSRPGQTWKNILSVGDGPEERRAIFELAALRDDPNERLRAKTVSSPIEPSLEKVTESLRRLHSQLEALVRFDGSLDVDLFDDFSELSSGANCKGSPRSSRSRLESDMKVGGLGFTADAMKSHEQFMSAGTVSL